MNDGAGITPKRFVRTQHPSSSIELYVCLCHRIGVGPRLQYQIPLHSDGVWAKASIECHVMSLIIIKKGGYGV
jgi:hypothetical protein